MNTQHTPELRDAFETAANNFGYGALQKHDDGRYLWAPTYHAWNGFQLGVKHAEQQRDELLVVMKEAIDSIRYDETYKAKCDLQEAISKVGG